MHNYYIKALEKMRDLYSERRSDVAEVCQHILDGKDFEHIPEHRYVHWNYGGKQFMYDTLTTHVEVCENRELRILEDEHKRRMQNEK